MPVTQGIHQLYTSAEQIAPFRIVTPSGADTFYIKLTDASTGVLVMTFFVQGGQSFEAVVPVGTYRVKYATGATWYGVDFLFGPDTRYSEAVKIFEFSVRNKQISGNTLPEAGQGQGGFQPWEAFVVAGYPDYQMGYIRDRGTIAVLGGIWHDQQLEWDASGNLIYIGVHEMHPVPTDAEDDHTKFTSSPGRAETLPGSKGR